MVIAKLNLRETVLKQKNTKHNSRENKLVYSIHINNIFGKKNNIISCQSWVICFPIKLMMARFHRSLRNWLSLVLYVSEIISKFVKNWTHSVKSADNFLHIIDIFLKHFMSMFQKYPVKQLPQLLTNLIAIKLTTQVLFSVQHHWQNW